MRGRHTNVHIPVTVTMNPPKKPTYIHHIPSHVKHDDLNQSQISASTGHSGHNLSLASSGVHHWVPNSTKASSIPISSTSAPSGMKERPPRPTTSQSFHQDNTNTMNNIINPRARPISAPSSTIKQQTMSRR